jgi:hypothetical protein
LCHYLISSSSNKVGKRDLQSTTESSVQSVELPLASVSKKGVTLKNSFGRVWVLLLILAHLLFDMVDMTLVVVIVGWEGREDGGLGYSLFDVRDDEGTVSGVGHGI